MFTWADPDDETAVITLPQMADIPGRVLRQVIDLGDVAAMVKIVESTADPDSLAAFDALPLRKINAMWQAWTGGASPGESAGSST